jgi:hypothetical protein
MAREPLHFLSKKIHCHVCHIEGSPHATYIRYPVRNACARVKGRTLGTDELVGLSSTSGVPVLQVTPLTRSFTEVQKLP